MCGCFQSTIGENHLVYPKKVFGSLAFLCANFHRRNSNDLDLLNVAKRKSSNLQAAFWIWLHQSHYYYYLLFFFISALLLLFSQKRISLFSASLVSSLFHSLSRSIYLSICRSMLVICMKLQKTHFFVWPGCIETESIRAHISLVFTSSFTFCLLATICTCKYVWTVY